MLTGFSFFWEVWFKSSLCLLLTVFFVSRILLLGVITVLGFIVGYSLIRADLTMVVLSSFLAIFSLFLVTSPPVIFFLIFLYPWGSLDLKLESEED